MREAVIVEALRTPLGKGRPERGALSGLHPATLLGSALTSLFARSGVDPGEVDDVIVGCVSQVGEQSTNIGRSAWLGAGLPEHVPATTVDRQCGSSQQALHFGAQAILAGHADVVVVAGVESMSRVPMFSNRVDQDPHGPGLAERYAPGMVNQGISAELVVARHGISRQELDELALTSHARAAEAAAGGSFDAELVPVAVGEGWCKEDEGIRRGGTLEAMAALKPAFVDDEAATRFPELGDWRITAGNSSQVSDGAAALLVMEAGRARALGLRPLAAVRHAVVVGDDPVEMLSAVVPATQRLLDRAGMGIGDIDLFEVNEAFASVPLHWLRSTGADPERMNVHGGAIALGHPLGASGARLMVTLVHALHRRGATFGLQTMCEAGGMANATLVERLS